MRIRKNTIIEIGEGRYRILGRTSLKWKDYYLAWQIDEKGDCLEDAQFVADMVKERFGTETFLINYVGPSIGAHSGPGTVALFFMGEKR